MTDIFLSTDTDELRAQFEEVGPYLVIIALFPITAAVATPVEISCPFDSILKADGSFR